MKRLWKATIHGLVPSLLTGWGITFVLVGLVLRLPLVVAVAILATLTGMLMAHLANPGAYVQMWAAHRLIRLSRRWLRQVPVADLVCVMSPGYIVAITHDPQGGLRLAVINRGVSEAIKQNRGDDTPVPAQLMILRDGKRTGLVYIVDILAGLRTEYAPGSDAPSYELGEVVVVERSSDSTLIQAGATSRLRELRRELELGTFYGQGLRRS